MVRIVSGEEHLRNLFAGILENTFHSEIGVADPGLTDYLTRLLLRFVRHENIFRIRDLRGERLEEIGKMLAEAENAENRPKREIHRHIGDFTLFWTGLYPEALRVLRGFDRQDHLIDYREQGKRSYYIASTFSQEPYEEEAPILRQLSELFDLCIDGLTMVRNEWELAA